MPLLRNPRHERLALELAGGKSATAAYAAAGFTPNRSNAGKLRRKEHILRRVEELLVEHESTQTLATQHAIETTGLTKAWVIEMLRMNAERALQEREVIESGECRLRKPKMSYQRILIATLITIIACVSSTEIQA